MTISHPPQLNNVLLNHNTRLRFIAASARANAITFQQLLDTILFSATAVQPYDVFETVRVNSVEAWALPAIGTASTIMVEFSGNTTGITGDQQVHTDTSMGIQPAHVRCSPSAKSLASDYQLSTAAVAFFITAPAGTVVDVSLSFRGPNSTGAGVTAQNASVASPVGQTGWRGLDGLAVATTQWVPQGVLNVI